MRTLILSALVAAVLALPAAAAPPSDTLQAVVAKGQTMTGEVGGQEVSFTTTFSPDGAFKTVVLAPDRTMTGTYRLDGDKLCTSGPAGSGIEDCTAYPAGKRSGDTFEVTHPRLGPAKVTIH